MNVMSPAPIVREIRHFHFFCGLGGGAKGFNRGTARVGAMQARFRCIGGIDSDPAAIRDFERAAGVRGTVLDLFSLDQSIAFHGREPPAGWRETTIDDVRQAAGGEVPHIVFLSAPCKGFSGLLSEAMSKSGRYQALNGLTLRGVWLMLEAWADDPPELIVFENVPRIAKRGRRLLDQIEALLTSYGYAVAETTHDCGELGGLAQSRKRFLLVARHRAKVPAFLYEPEKKRLRGVGEVLDRLPVPGLGLGGPMHRVPSLQWRTWVRLAFVDAGSDWRSLSRLNVADGMLTEYGIAPEQPWRAGVLGVNGWDDTAQTISGRGGPTNGGYAVANPRRFEGRGEYGQYGVKRWEDESQAITGNAAVGTGDFAVADPRFAGETWPSGQYGVRGWNQRTGAVTGQRSPGQGGFSVADPRMDGPPRFNNVYRVVRFGSAAPAVTGGGGPTAGGLAVADPRAPAGAHASKYRVTRRDEAAGAVIAASTTGQGAFAVADPRTGWAADAHPSKLAIQEWEETARTVTGARVQSGALCVADPRPGYGSSTYRNILRVTEWEDTARTVTSGHHPAGGGLCVADPRPEFARDGRVAYVTGGHYGVVPWDAASGSVTASGQHDNGRWSVADPRGGAGDDATELPAADARLVAVIQAEDGTWHRPFTTLELAALQSLIEPEEFLELDGLSDSAWRERIGNAVPPDAAQAVASEMGRTLLLAWSGQTFILSNAPIWVQQIAIALTVSQPLSEA